MIPLPPSRSMASPIRSLSSAIRTSRVATSQSRSASASTSIRHVGQQATGATSSIARAGQTGRNTTSIQRLQAVSSSVNRAASQENYGDTSQQDESYYAHARRLVKERLQKEAEAKTMTSSSSPVPIATGHSFRSKPFEKKMSKFFRTHKGAYGSMSKEQKKAFTTMVGNRAKRKTTPGTGLSYQDVKGVKRELYKKKHDLGLSSTQTKRLQSLVSSMKKST